MDTDEPVKLDDANSVFYFKTHLLKDWLNIADVSTDVLFNPLLSKEDYYREIFYPELSHDGKHVTFHSPSVNHWKQLQQEPFIALRNETLRQLFMCSGDNANDAVLIRNSTFGTLSGLYTSRFEDLVDYHEQFYRPSNTLLFGYGNVSPSAMLENLEQSLRTHRKSSELDAAVAKMYGRQVPRELAYVVASSSILPAKKHEFLVPETERFQYSNNDAMVAFGFLGDKNWARGDPVRRLAMRVLFDSLRDPTGPFPRELQQRIGASDSTTGESLGTQLESIFRNRINVPDDYFAMGFESVQYDKVAKLEAVFFDCLVQLAERGYTEAEVARTINRAKVLFKDPIRSIESLFDNMTAAWTTSPATADPAPITSFVNLNYGQVFQGVNSPLNVKNFNAFVKSMIKEMFLEANPNRVTVVAKPSKKLAQEQGKLEKSLQEQYVATQAPTIAPIMPNIGQQYEKLVALKQKDVTFEVAKQIYDTEELISSKDLLGYPHAANFNSKFEEEYIDANRERKIMFNEQADCDGLVEITCVVYPKYAFRGHLRGFFPLIAKLLQTSGARAMDGEELYELQLEHTAEGIRIEPVTNVLPNGNVKYGLQFSCRCLHTNVYKVMDLYQALLTESDVVREPQDEQSKRLWQQETVKHIENVLQQELWDLRARSQQNPAQFAASHATSFLDKYDYTEDYFHGFSYVNFITYTLHKMKEDPQEGNVILEMVNSFVKSLIAINGGVHMLVTSSAKHKDTVIDAARDFFGAFAEQHREKDDGKKLGVALVEQEPFEQKSGMMYVETPFAGNDFIVTQTAATVDMHHKDAPALFVASCLLSTFLREQVTERGGPRIVCIQNEFGVFTVQILGDYSPFQTLDIVKRAVNEWLPDEGFTAHELEVAKLEAFRLSKLDIVRAPHDRALRAFRLGLNEAKESKYRQGILSVTSDDIVRVAHLYLQKVDYANQEEVHPGSADKVSPALLQHSIEEKNQKIIAQTDPEAAAKQKELVQEQEKQHKRIHGDVPFRKGCMLLLGPKTEYLDPMIRNTIENGDWNIMK